MRKWFDLIMANQEDLAQLMTAEQGKPLAETRGEVVYGASFIEWFAEEGKRVYGDVIPTMQSGPAHHRAERADRRRRRDHAVEFPQRHDHAQMRAGARRRLHLPHQARGGDTTFSASRLPNSRTAPVFPPAYSMSFTSNTARESGRRTHAKPYHAEILVHGLDGNRQDVDAQCATTVKKVSLELGRQRALHRLR